MLVEHFLRAGYYDTAMGLAKQANIEDLTNINLFLVAKEVEDALSQKDVNKCLAWCHDNKSKLRKMKSTLEYNVRLQGGCFVFKGSFIILYKLRYYSINRQSSVKPHINFK